MSKRSSDPADMSCKRKHNSLSISKKVELLRKLERGTPVRKLCDEYGVGKSTIYDLQKKKKELLEFFSDSDTPLQMQKRKTMHSVKNEDLDKIMIEWFRQRRNENVPLTGPMLMQQAKNFHKELNLTTPCEYSTGWLTKFKRRHGIRQLRVCGERASADHEAAEQFIDDFNQLISEQNLTPEQIYNADETSLFWRYVPRKTLATVDEDAPTGIKDAKERLTVLACANAAGTHKCKLLVIGKSARPRAFKGVKTFPVHYKSNKRAWITQEITTDWFQNHFVPESRAHCRAIGLPEDSKILLLLDNCSAHPPADLLVKENTYVLYFPPNCTSLLQPMDMGVLRSLKCLYKTDFLNRLLHSVNNCESVRDYVKQFNVKDAVWSVARAWDNVKEDTLKHAWHNLWPATLFTEDKDEHDFGGFHTSKTSALKNEISDLLAYAKNSNNMIDLNLADIEEVINIDKDAPTINTLTDGEICDMVLNKNKTDTDSSSDEDCDNEEKMPLEKLLNSLDDVIKGLEQRNFVTEQELMSVYRIKEKVIAEKSKLMKQLKITDMFRINSTQKE